MWHSTHQCGGRCDGAPAPFCVEGGTTEVAEFPEARARLLLARLGYPRSLRALCRRLSVRVRRVAFDAGRAGTDALLVPVRGGFVVAISRGVVLSEREKSLRVCHEIGHTLSYDRAGDGSPRRKSPVTAEEERFCDAFAEGLFVLLQAQAGSGEGV